MLQGVMPPLAPRFHRCSGAVMLLDISGFSSLASQLAKEESLRIGPNLGIAINRETTYIVVWRFRQTLVLNISLLQTIMLKRVRWVLKKCAM